jgi:hypothetical protein
MACSLPHLLAYDGNGLSQWLAAFHTYSSTRRHQHRHHITVKSSQQQTSYHGIDIAPQSSHLESAIVSITRYRHHVAAAPLGGLARTSPISNSTQKITTDQTKGLDKYHSNRQPDSDVLLPTSLTSTRGEHVIITMIWDTSSNQLSHFLSYILSQVNILIYFQMINILF